eukprot:6188874-Pleurochrysis_carterae.AAC.1
MPADGSSRCFSRKIKADAGLVRSRMRLTGGFARRQPDPSAVKPQLPRVTLHWLCFLSPPLT